jgi:hypothetical protein
MEFPYDTPQVLTDDIFVLYGGQTGTSSAAQRQAAYLLAEEQMTEHLSAFLVPTIVTGTAWYRGGTLFETEYGQVQQVLLFTSEEVKQFSPLQLENVTGSVMVRNARYGYLDVILPCDYAFIHANTVVYQSGFASGTVTRPSMLSALSLAAQINLNEWDVSLSNEGVADIGIQQFSNQSYSEQRVKLGRNAFGSSAMAQRVKRLVMKYQSKPAARFR